MLNKTSLNLQDSPNNKFSLTARAAKRINEIVVGDFKYLRLEILAGGCSGFQYKFDIVKTCHISDCLFTLDNATVVVDPTSLDLLKNSQLDYKDELMGSYFSVQNPQAVSTCGCGTSFNVD